MMNDATDKHFWPSTLFNNYSEEKTEGGNISRSGTKERWKVTENSAAKVNSQQPR